MNYSITQYGKPLDPSIYTINKETKTLSSNEDNLVLNFHGLNRWTFKTGSHCIFNTGSNCTFNTGSNCVLNTGYECTFNTRHDCTFNTSYDCTFNTGYQCVCIRRDSFEIIEIPEGTKIILNGVKGYKVLKDTKY